MKRALNVLSLFTGAGGLDLGLEAAGFVTRICIENDPDSLATLARNRPSWAIAQPQDAIQFARKPLAALRRAGIRRSEVCLLAGGPPCQPFSKAGNWTKLGPKGMRDPRASGTIGAYIRIVREIRPEVLVFENVAGFAFQKRADGYKALARGLRRINRKHGTRYDPRLIKINAADYGIPQLRERMFVIAHRGGRAFQMPPPTHGPRSSTGKPYVTAWDAIGDLDQDLPELAPQGRWAGLLPSIPEGKNYLWHTPGQGGSPLFGWRTRYWSFLLKLAKNKPSWTVSASPGPAIGPFHWRSRLLSVKELCRLQTFPDGYQITGNRRAAQRQVGNAVPAALAEFLGLEIRRQLLGTGSVPHRVSLAIQSREDCPRAERVQAVPRTYRRLAGRHEPHPGTGKGPARTSKEQSTPTFGVATM
jgi:DNA (cytosine-5)-methyltransferase 1